MGQRQEASGYEQFFGFIEPPFSLSVNARFRFESASHLDALSQVTRALERREPIVVVTGEIGIGKTLLCRTVAQRLPRTMFLSVINDPMLGRDDLLKRILEDFGVISQDGAPLVQTSRHELVHALEKFLASLGKLDAHALVVVDEAQHVRADVLEEIRLLANIQDDRGTLLQIALVGQPSLRVLLETAELIQLRQRITRFVSLNPLSHDEVKEYIAHRVSVAQETPTRSNVPGARALAVAIAEWNNSIQPVTFTDDAVAAIVRISRGVPRVVNLLCDRALETAFGQQATTVTEAHVAVAASLLQLPDDHDRADANAPVSTAAAAVGARRLPLWAVAAAAVVAVAAAAVWIGGRAIPAQKPDVPAAVPASAPQPPLSHSPVRPEPPAATPPRSSEGANGPSEAAGQLPPATEPASSVESFEIVVASFRTETRATEVASQLAAIGQQARRRSRGGWEQLVAGPFESRAAASEVQQQLDRAGFKETVIVKSVER